MFAAIRSFVAKTDILTRGTYPEPGPMRREAAFMHTLNGAIQGVNTIVAGTPIAWVTGPVAMAVAGAEWGLGGVLTFFSAGTSLSAKDEGKGIRKEAGLAFVAGACAAIPVVGHYVNGVAAGYNAVHAANNYFAP